MSKLRKIPLMLSLELSDLRDMLVYYFLGKARKPFNLKARSLGFADHRTKADTSEDLAIAKRLLAAYQKAKADEKKAAEPYQVRGEWEHIINIEYARLLKCLREGDATGLAAMLTNFCRNECSRGLAMSSDFTVNRYRPLYRFRYLLDFIRSVEDWEKTGQGNFDPKIVAMPLVGNPVGLTLGGFLVPRVNIRHRYYAQRLIEIAPKKEAVFAEIGGGYGGLAYFLLLECGERARYINFDLPEINVVAGYYLLKTFPQKKTALYGEGCGLMAQDLQHFDIIVYPHFTFPDLPDKSVDVVFNSNSLAEMDEMAVGEYYQQITRSCLGHFFHVNHDDERVYDARKNKKHIRLSNYHLNEDFFRVIFSKKESYFNPDYYEYLYERKK